jgi:SAM-dependent methyltransferase
VTAGVPPVDDDALVSDRFTSLDDWRRARDAAGGPWHARWQMQQWLAPAVGTAGWRGQCPLCRRATVFELPSQARGEPANLREELVCRGCGLNARVRAALALLIEALAERSGPVYLTEQASPAFVWMQQRFPDVLGSEYTEDPVLRLRLQRYLGTLGGQGSLRFEDVTALSFADASLAAVASFDVLEHVPDYPRALAEFARVLVPGGRLVLTAPFLDDAPATLTRARISPEGDVEHLQPPEYHGDPVAGGVLCFYHFGWDLLEAVHVAGFSDAAMVHPWRLDSGLPSGLWTLVARR